MYVVETIGLEPRIVFTANNKRTIRKYCRENDTPGNPLTVTQRKFVGFGNEI